MTTIISCVEPASFSAGVHLYNRSLVTCVPNRQRQMRNVRSNAQKNPQNRTSSGSQPESVLLKMAWYGSELLGIAASLFRSRSSNQSNVDSPAAKLVDGLDLVDRSTVVRTIKKDFEMSYFVTGNVSVGVYQEECEFADPAGSFRGLRRFRRNCTNFGLLLETSNMNLIKWEDFEDKGIAHWRFSCIMVLPWKPILSATGYTEYYFDAQTGKICRHVEHWNVPKMALLKQIMMPSKGYWNNTAGR